MTKMPKFLYVIFLFSAIFTLNCSNPSGMLECDVDSDCPANHYCRSGEYCIPKDKIETGGDKEKILVDTKEQLIDHEFGEDINEQRIDEYTAELNDAGELPEEIPREPERTIQEERFVHEESTSSEEKVSPEILPESEKIDPCDKYKKLFGKPCVTGKPGICTEGSYTCASGKLICIQKNQPAKETCDRLDNDCNGQIDDGIPCCTAGNTLDCGTVPLKGLCKRGRQTCLSDGSWGPCIGLVEPKPETCDGLDNDCDGAIDEDLGKSSCGVGECFVEVNNCSSGKPQSCVPKQPSTEVCDGKDNNCNGQIDENLGTLACGVGECSNTVQKCVGGVAQTCTPMPSSKEICDGKDNDCDGVVDNGFNLQVDKNNCGKCGTQCTLGQLCLHGRCCGGSYGVEVCSNNIDDNCDGQTDESNCSALEFLLVPQKNDNIKIPDVSGKGRHAGIKNGGRVVTLGAKTYFDTSIKGYAVITNVGTLQTTSVESFTVMVYAQITTTPSYGASFIIRSPGTSLSLSHWANKYVGYCGTGMDRSPKTSLVINKYVHLTYVYNKAASTVKFYIDGKLDGTSTNITCSAATSSSYMFISWNPLTGVYTDYHMKARYAKIAYISRALSDKEISIAYSLQAK
ncbi:hypothetical protein KKH43_02435 [Patescibacteria group bacterium]|nr:hypothetical protein [Patescibacteria group bacterium]